MVKDIEIVQRRLSRMENSIWEAASVNKINGKRPTGEPSVF